MKKYFILSTIFFFILSTYSHAIKLHRGDTYTGVLNKLGNHITNVKLPPGDWKLESLETKVMGNRWVNTSFVLYENNKVVAWIYIGVPRNVSSNGWNPSNDIVCDDFENQGSNYHYTSTPTYSVGWIKGKLSCHNIYVQTKVDNGWGTGSKIMQETFQIWDRNNITYPNALVDIGYEFIEKQNWVSITIGLNPEFAGISDQGNEWWKESNWHRSKIKNYTERNEYMNKAINETSYLRDVMFVQFNKKRKGIIDLNYGNIISGLLPLSKKLNP